MKENRHHDYVHRDLDHEVTAIGGHYRFSREEIFFFGGRPVLYLSGYALFDTTCCGAGGCGYSLVQGYVERWKYRSDPEGLFVSRVEEIRKAGVREELARRIQAKEKVQQVGFRAWL